MTEAEGRLLDLPIVRGRSGATEATTGDMGGTGDDRTDEFSLSFPLRSDGGREDGPEVSEESSSLKSPFFILLNSAADPSGIPGLEDTSDRCSSSSNALALVFFFLLTGLAGLSTSSIGRCTITVSRSWTVLVTFLAGLGNRVDSEEDGLFG